MIGYRCPPIGDDRTKQRDKVRLSPSLKGFARLDILSLCPSKQLNCRACGGCSQVEASHQPTSDTCTLSTGGAKTGKQRELGDM